MKKIYSRIAALALMLASVNAIAQDLESAFFTDGYLYRHEMNPAIENSRNYVSMLALGNMNYGMSGNLGINDVMFNRNGKLMLFTNPQIDAADFMSGINDNNRVNTNIRFNIMGAGFKAWGGYNTVGINLRFNADVVIPKSLFELAKNGLKNQTYDIGGFGAEANSYVEIALGHSRKINDKWRVGGKVKFLVGAGSINANVSNAILTLGENGYTAEVDAEMNNNIEGLNYKTKVSEHNYKTADGQTIKRNVFNGFDYDSFNLNGFGLAFDLGGEFKINEDWRVLASVLDLGFISWKNTRQAATHGTVNTSDHVFNVDDDAPNNFEDEWDKLGDDLASIYELGMIRNPDAEPGSEDEYNIGGRTSALAATMNIGGEYVFPYYRKLTFGLMNTTRINGKYSWTNFRLSANVAPLKWLSGGINFGLGTFGPSFGWILNIHPKGFNLFLGMDHTLGKLAKQGVPLSSNAELSMGINFPF